MSLGCIEMLLHSHEMVHIPSIEEAHFYVKSFMNDAQTLLGLHSLIRVGYAPFDPTFPFFLDPLITNRLTLARVTRQDEEQENVHGARIYLDKLFSENVSHAYA